MLKFVSIKLTTTEDINTSAPPRGWQKGDVVIVTNNYETVNTGRFVNYVNTEPYVKSYTI